MADWKMQMSYNFNPSYHAYAYGLMYPQTSEHGHPNLSWTEAAYTHAGGSFYSSQTAQQSPPWSPENTSANNYWQYQTNTQNGRLFVSNNTELDPKAKDAEQAESDTPSDSEAHTPDSWSSGSSREGAALTNFNLLSWREEDHESDSGSPDATELISNSISVVKEGPVDLNLGVEGLPLVPPSVSPERPVVQTRKTRAAFSEEQMNALVHRFNVQRYLTPAEMKSLAEATGLTYKQVKTWFQNRRMKLKRHQRDSSWMTERYVINGASSAPAPLSQPQSDISSSNKEAYSNSQLRESIFKSPPHTFYPSYSKPHSPPQATIRHPGNWPLPPAVMHYTFPNATNYMQASINSDVGNAVAKGSSPVRMASVPSATQWST